MRVEAELFGPITLGAPAGGGHSVAKATAALDKLVWAASDTTAQQDATLARKGGRAIFRWSGADFSGAAPGCCFAATWRRAFCTSTGARRGAHALREQTFLLRMHSTHTQQAKR